MAMYMYDHPTDIVIYNNGFLQFLERRTQEYLLQPQFLTSCTLNQSTDGAEISFHERVRKLLSSPLSRRKSASNAAASSSREGGKLKVFGSPLFNLAHVDHPPSTQYLHSYRKEPGIPYVMTRLCDFIEKESGLNQEGLFRISANVRLVEKLRRSFDESGDAPLEDAGDVAAAAALLKQFLRDLPQPVIPTHLNQPFFAAVRGKDFHDMTVPELCRLSPVQTWHRDRRTGGNDLKPSSPFSPVRTSTSSSISAPFSIVSP